MIETRRDGAVMTITLDRPAKKNALTLDMRGELTRAFIEAQSDDAVRAVVLAATGDSFCAGADVESMGRDDVKSARHRLKHHAHGMIRALYDIEKPVIAAVRGTSAGIGWSLALACDLTIASETARFSAIFARRGLAPDGGCAFFLARLVGLARAREIVFSTRFVGAEEARGLGIVLDVVPDGELEGRAQAKAAELAAQPTLALGMAKRMLQRALSPGLEDFLEYEAVVQTQMMQSADFKEGVASFREKRPPTFEGR